MEAKGIKVKALRTRVKIDPRSRLTYYNFWVLSATRDFSSSGWKPLKPTEVRCHLEVKGFKGWRGERMYDLILSLDSEFLKIRNKANNSNSSTTVTQVIEDE